MRLKRSIISIIPLLMRFGAAGARLLLLFVIASYGSDSLMGEYAILMVFVGLGTQFFGFELNAAVGRIIHTKPNNEKFKLLSSQFSLHLVTYLLLFAPLLLLLQYFFSGSTVSIFLYVIVIYLEHFAVEAYRILVTLLKPKEASYFHFYRNVPFVAFLTVISLANPTLLNIQIIAIAWILNSAASLIVLHRQYSRHAEWRESIHITSIRSAAMLALKSRYLYLISCSGALAAYIDKLIIFELLGKEAVGKLYFFFSLASAISLIVSFTVGVKEGPLAIKQYQEGHFSAFARSKINMQRRYLAIAGSTSLVLISLFLLVGHLGYNKYYDYAGVYFLILVSVSVAIQADVIKLDYYLQVKDGALLFINLAHLSFTFASVFLLSTYLGMQGAAMAMVVSSVLLVFLLHYSKSISQVRKYL